MHLAQAIRTEQATEQIGDQVTEQVGRLLEYLKAGPIDVKEIMTALSLRHRSTFVADYLNPALGAGLVEMTRPDSPRSPTQKYRLRRAHGS